MLKEQGRGQGTGKGQGVKGTDIGKVKRLRGRGVWVWVWYKKNENEERKEKGKVLYIPRNGTNGASDNSIRFRGIGRLVLVIRVRVLSTSMSYVLTALSL